MSATKDLFNGAVIIGTGAYLIDVAYQGKILDLGKALKEETGYIDFVVSLFILGLIQSYGPLSKVSGALMIITLTGLSIKVGNNSNLLGSIQKFASGEATIVETFKTLSGVN